MSRGTSSGGLRSSTTWAFFVVFALILLTRNVAYAEICNYDGGWSMRRESSCTTIASKRCNSTWDGSQVLCCPDRYVCSGEDDFQNQYCCKDKNSCMNQAINDPKCPDPSMSLWGTNDRDDGLWCCASEDVGVYKNTGQVDGLVFLCTGTEVTTLATTLSSATLLSQCSMTSTPTSISASTSTTASTSANASGEEDSPAGVPAGAIAGGVVGGVAGIALVVAGIYFLKKKKKSDPEEQPSTEVPVQEGQQWSQQRWPNSQRRRPSELETVEPRLEMNGVKPTYELDATEEQARERDVSPLSPPR